MFYPPPRFTPSANVDSSKSRLCFLDAARGFVMSIVVFQHVRAFGLGLNADDGTMSFVYLYFFLTTFFLVSGFLSDSLLQIDKGKQLILKLLYKFRTLIIPTILFWIVYNLIAYRNNSKGTWGFPGGYWFTYTLFLISAVTGIVAFALKKIRCQRVVLILLTMSFLFQIARVLFPSQIDTGILYYLRARQFSTYFLYFIFGIFMSANKYRVYSFINNQRIQTILFGGTILLFLGRYVINDMIDGLIISGMDFILSFFSTLTVFSIFFLTKNIGI